LRIYENENSCTVHVSLFNVHLTKFSQVQAMRKWSQILDYTSFCAYKYMLFAGWEVHTVKNCDWSPRSQFFTIRTDPRPVNKLFIFFQALKWKKTHTSITVTMVRDRKIWTMLRTNQMIGFITMPTWKKINIFI